MRIKKAFTLGEMLLVFVIIGILATIGLSTVKPWEKAFKYSYMRMYNALSLTIYNHMINTSEDDAFPNTDEKFCNTLLQWINTADKSETTPTCDGSNIGKDPSEFKDETMRFRASNGAKVWIGAQNDHKPFELVQSLDATTSEKIRYYMVFIDLNGDRRPNTPEWRPNQMADIVAFAVTDKYAVIPLGYPEIDTRYLIAHVVYPSLNTDYSDTDDDAAKYTGDEDVISDPKSYYEAKINAYGDGVFAGNLKTYDFSSQFGNDSYFKVCKWTNTTTKDCTGTAAQRYNSHYPTTPVFDNEACAFEGTTNEPVCMVKIYDYH